MERNITSAEVRYDLSPISELFKDCISPEELREELIELAFDYMQYIDDGKIDYFKSKMSALYILCDALKEIKIIAA
ncbi:hypothetical protein DWY58_18335 [Bacteroides stercoris]|jgi:hypothetical protein|uniref:Uncharacterized protein n=1 Tax=Bacteroides stercoris TaxID=46506 RepID=A0A412DY56_BACSE|nr:hypothetical protein [Bacteroides stercoris]RGR25281.1 hypothetical protein DWY58_18335 [Bacteroides stercoris]RGR31071.1 hypothetical protein DWY52_18470 [Bacteroides stercoris]